MKVCKLNKKCTCTRHTTPYKDTEATSTGAQSVELTRIQMCVKAVKLLSTLLDSLGIFDTIYLISHTNMTCVSTSNHTVRPQAIARKHLFPLPIEANMRK